MEDFPQAREHKGLDRRAADIAHRLEFVDILIGRLNCNVFLLSYRG